MKPMKIFIFSIALCLMACAVSAGDIHGVEDEASVEPMVPELPNPISIGDKCKEDIPVIAGIQYGGVMKELTPAGDSVEVYIPSINPHNIPSYIPVQISYMSGQC